MPETILEMRHITKIFPGVKALDDVPFTLRKGEIHAIVGENGAGKSTFIKVLAGVHHPDGGEIILNGRPIHMDNPLVAQSHGIAAIHQHAASYPDLSVAENIFIGHEFMTGPFINWKKANAEAQKLLKSIGANVNPAVSVGVLSVAQQQMVEIAKALSQNAQILIMDEPTAALSKQESEELYCIARNLRDKGQSIILISHRFEDIFGLADRVTVLRDAKYIGTWDMKADHVDEAMLVHHMVGYDISQFFPKKKTETGGEVLRVEHLSRTGYFRDVSFHVNAGEIVGLTGLVGAGRTEVVEALFGVTKPDSGKVTLLGRAIRRQGPADCMKRGLSLLPEDRHKQALLLPWTIKDNMTLPILKQMQKGPFLSKGKQRNVGRKYFEMLSIRAPGVETRAEALSGGNQQKVVIGKQLAAQARVIILDEPTKGVDVGSKAQIYEIMSELAAQGIGILMISSEMPEVINMSDRIYVMSEGRVRAEFAAGSVTQQQILNAAMPAQRRA